jgi:hypothetical protein
MLSPDNFDNLILLAENQIIIMHNLPKIVSLQNNCRTIALVQKIIRATNRKRKAENVCVKLYIIVIVLVIVIATARMKPLLLLLPKVRARVGKN